jgi:hypothetical protein
LDHVETGFREAGVLGWAFDLKIPRSRSKRSVKHELIVCDLLGLWLARSIFGRLRRPKEKGKKSMSKSQRSELFFPHLSWQDCPIDFRVLRSRKGAPVLGFAVYLPGACLPCGGGFGRALAARALA